MTQASHPTPARKSILNPLADVNLNTPQSLESIYPDAEPVRILPDVNVVKIGGQSFIDRGREAMLPLREEIGRIARDHRLLIGAGGGTRARHASGRRPSDHLAPAKQPTTQVPRQRPVRSRGFHLVRSRTSVDRDSSS